MAEICLCVHSLCNLFSNQNGHSKICLAHGLFNCARSQNCDCNIPGINMISATGKFTVFRQLVSAAWTIIPAVALRILTPIWQVETWNRHWLLHVERCFSIVRLLLWWIHLSVTNVLCAKSIKLAAVIFGLYQCYFTLVSGDPLLYAGSVKLENEPPTWPCIYATLLSPDTKPDVDAN